MKGMVFDIQYGDGTFTTTLPERTRVIKQTTRPLPPMPDTAQAVRDALLSPVAHEPLQKLVNSKSTVTIAFDDPIGYLPEEAKPPFREIAIKVVLEELDKLGVPRANIRLVCAVGLHRKFTNRELGTIIGAAALWRIWRLVIMGLSTRILHHVRVCRRGVPLPPTYFTHPDVSQS